MTVPRHKPGTTWIPKLPPPWRTLHAALALGTGTHGPGGGGLLWPPSSGGGVQPRPVQTPRSTHSGVLSGGPVHVAGPAAAPSSRGPSGGKLALCPPALHQHKAPRANPASEPKPSLTTAVTEGAGDRICAEEGQTLPPLRLWSWTNVPHGVSRGRACLHPSPPRRFPNPTPVY